MRVVFAFLLLLVACSGVRCPEGYVSSSVDGRPACISALSYCTADEQCSSERYDCARPCLYLPVNVLFSQDAQKKAEFCERANASCDQVPFVDQRCVKHQCVAVPHTAEELIPLPALDDVEKGVKACYILKGEQARVHLGLHNNASMPLLQVEGVFLFAQNSSKKVSKTLLNGSMSPGEHRAITQVVGEGVPVAVDLFAVRTVAGRSVSFGVKNEGQYLHVPVQACVEKRFI